MTQQTTTTQNDLCILFLYQRPYIQNSDGQWAGNGVSEDMLPHQVSLTQWHCQSLSLCVRFYHSHIISDLQTLDPGVLDDVPLAPQLVRQHGAVPGADQGAGTGASLLSARDQMDVSVNVWPAGDWDTSSTRLSVVCSISESPQISHDQENRQTFRMWK